MSDDHAISVMIIDDHAVFAESLAAALNRQSDIEVVATSSGDDKVLDVTAEHQPDVILLDYRLPGQDGLRLASDLKTAAPETKLVVLTAIVDERVALDAVEAGCVGFITKDRGLEDVVRSIRSVHDGEVMVSPDMLALILPRLRDGDSEAAPQLTRREHEVLELVAEGCSNQAIADRLTLSLHTVRNHVQNILRKLDAHSKLEAVAIATRQGILASRR
ncbi:MAG: response regulator transcription factor [Actinomycetota bacterium]